MVNKIWDDGNGSGLFSDPENWDSGPPKRMVWYKRLKWWIYHKFWKAKPKRKCKPKIYR